MQYVCCVCVCCNVIALVPVLYWLGFCWESHTTHGAPPSIEGLTRMLEVFGAGVGVQPPTLSSPPLLHLRRCWYG